MKPLLRKKNEPNNRSNTYNIYNNCFSNGIMKRVNFKQKFKNKAEVKTFLLTAIDEYLRDRNKLILMGAINYVEKTLYGTKEKDTSLQDDE